MRAPAGGPTSGVDPSQRDIGLRSVVLWVHFCSVWLLGVCVLLVLVLLSLSGDDACFLLHSTPCIRNRPPAPPPFLPDAFSVTVTIAVAVPRPCPHTRPTDHPCHPTAPISAPATSAAAPATPLDPYCLPPVTPLQPKSDESGREEGNEDHGSEAIEKGMRKITKALNSLRARKT